MAGDLASPSADVMVSQMADVMVAEMDTSSAIY